MADYDIVIIGGSPAGRYAAAIAAQMKATVALVERELEFIGAHRGAPLLESAVEEERLLTSPFTSHLLPHSLSYIGQLAQQCDKLGIFGLNLRCGDASQDGQISVKWKQITQWVQGVRANLEEENSPVVLAALGVDFIQGQAKFVAQPQLGLVVNNRSLVARNYLIATNPRPLIPDIEGLEATRFLTASEVLPSLTAANSPRRWAILGGDPSGCQLAQTLARLGLDVTLIVKRPQILLKEDPEIAQLLQAILEAEGVRVLTDTAVTQVKAIDGKKWIQADREAIEFDEIVLCAGQQPDLEYLNLEAVGVRRQRRRLHLNQKLQTTNSHIYACGDAIGGYQFAHIANYEAKIALQNALQNALFSPQYKVDYHSIPWLVCTDPPLARVGFTATQARQKYGNDVLVLQQYFKTLTVAQIRDEMTGICQVVVRRNGTILGAAIIGSQAGELINVIALAIAQQLKIDAIAHLVPVYPSWGEILVQTANEYLSTPLGQGNWLQNLLAKLGCRV
jgi:pyruvate/2-oxoglutarate dehydrogenase complex dihydrolipoamide dehydrogenase (E3) component